MNAAKRFTAKIDVFCVRLIMVPGFAPGIFVWRRQ